MIQRIITHVMLNILIQIPPPPQKTKYNDIFYKLYIIEEQFLTIVN